ncbi:phosphoinositide 3-kinase regulatory subunit 4-like [Saccoglossus kowalevskii]|uniref:non-specific serine/threonine protein kinase n=1 Tax=Saccoglossus kowalevskii TaxID=10224 RepID=A0ABM0M513_SACKO|nr:PREDICTED: phosphoinositide 3-kinase regulatory subunit 4-like [Saccoglossus kowalevskii]
MGNQLAGIAPSQILSVDNYLTDVTDYEYDCNLGSTRFFKVAKAKYKEGLAVVKVFAIHDPSLPIKPHKDKVEDIKSKLLSAPNCLPFQRSTLSDKAALLFRQYVRGNLYDRISTRPFLNSVEKKWIAFQLLCALDQAHRVKVCHGDIKTENVMVTSWNWVLLTDFASFKPTYLPDNNPSDFNFFFDTSRRRTCYIAPERFVDVTSKQQQLTEIEKGVAAMLESLPDSEIIQKGELTPAMDIFSAGCVIAELFTEGHPPFHLSTLLAYRNDAFYPDKINEIEAPHVKELVKHMIHKDPNKRYSAEEYIQKWRGFAFPDYFYTYLKSYMGDFALLPILPPDEKIARIHKDIKKILNNLCPKDEDGCMHAENNGGLVIVISMITSCLRSLKFCIAKLSALELMSTLAKHVTSEIVLDRLIPYMIYFVNDPFARVRAHSLKTLTQSLALVKNVPRSDANIFREYILPNLTNLTLDQVVSVRITYAENIASLAETALRFLEITQLDHGTQEEESDSILDPSVQYQGSYDAELQDLHEMIQQKVVTLLSDPENIVKRTLLENGITRLCVFFGRQKANDVLLSHMITFLNDKNDWHLRGAFFDNIVGVAAYVGWQSSSILKPLLQQRCAMIRGCTFYIDCASIRKCAAIRDAILLEMRLLLVCTCSQFILAYATVYGSLIGWDLRAPGNAWKLKNEQKHGLITSFSVDHKRCWLSVGTSSGIHVCWDMRFQLPITTLTHPTGTRVRQLLMHPLHQSWVISAVEGNNEVSMWDMETGARQMTLWASTTPALSQTQASSHSVHTMYCSLADGNPFLVTAGSDMRMRFWDLAYPQSSYIIAGAANDHLHQTAVSYKHKLVDGTEVIQETYSKQRGTSDDTPRRAPDPVPSGHRDTISDMTVFQTSQAFIATCSRDGVVKVWK